MFQALKHKFQTLKYMFQALKYKFQGLKQKNGGTMADYHNFLDDYPQSKPRRGDQITGRGVQLRIIINNLHIVTKKDGEAVPPRRSHAYRATAPALTVISQPLTFFDFCFWARNKKFLGEKQNVSSRETKCF